ncbi:MAG: hypothetical protein C0169_04950 [Thermodesulfobacterium geofontis]|uniref:TonB family protein n=1 Tax=Thermodesulfobacterium geofontis TaxID=1295609 RepID=A0A2N7QBX2_9BACT|nr:MAG: hypothetical protein C0169_04950 [Thermodesulfobacterium geofontis]
MFTKYDVFSYFLSILINIFFLLVFFSAFNLKLSKEEKVRIKLISSFNFVSPPVSTPLEEAKKPGNLISSSKEIYKENRISEEEVLKKRLAEIKSKISKGTSKTDYSLSENELREIEKRMLAFQKSNVSSKGAQSSQLSASSVGTTAVSEALGIEYILLIKRKLQNNFEVPIYLRSQRELNAIVRIEISSEGKILNYEFLKKSENSEFNKAIERCLKISSPLPINKGIKIIVEFKGEGIGKIK